MLLTDISVPTKTVIDNVIFDLRKISYTKHLSSFMLANISIAIVYVELSVHGNIL